MSLIDMAILALVQGITEFLPISSHGHLIVARALLGLPGDGLLMAIAVHVGTLFAVVVYFYREVWLMLTGLGRLVTGRGGPGVRLLVLVVVGTLPVLAVGYVVMNEIGEGLNTLVVIGWATLGFGVLLYVADRASMTVARIAQMRYGQAFIIGLFQVLALIPGTSRSGITMTAARLLGFERTEAARFSLLLSMPAILGAGTLAGIDLYQSGNIQLQTDAVIGAVFSFFTALGAIALMMAWLRRASFTPFVIYRVLLGGGLLIWAYFFQGTLA